MSLPILSKVLARAQSNLFGSWVPFAVLTLVLTALIALRGWSSYDEQTNTAQNQVKNITFVLAVELNRSLDGISRSLDFIVSQIKPEAMAAGSKSHYQNEINELLLQQVKLNSLSVGIRIFDARGDLIYSAVPNESSINVSHREYFNYLRQHPGDTYFSPSTFIGGLSGVPVLPIARGIHSSSGAFLGVVITTLPIKSLKEVFEELEVGAGGTVALRTVGSGSLIYRYPDNGEQTNHQLSNTPMEGMIASGIEDGTATYTTAADGVKRLYSFRVLDAPFPYSIYVGLAESDYLASWRKNMVFTIFGALVLDAFVGFFFFRQRQAYKKLNRHLKALELSQASLRLSELVIAKTNDAVVITQAEPHEQAGGPPIIFVNEAYTRETGYLAEEVIGRSPAILQGPKTDRATLDRIRAAIEKWQPVREEVLNYKKNGEEFWVDLEIIPIADETGWFTHWVSIQRNITERKLNEKILAEANHHLELAVRAGSVGIWEWDLVNNVLVFDEQMYRLYGISGDQFGGAYEAWQAALHPDDLEWADLEVQNVLAGLKEYDVIYRVVWPDGSIHHLHALGSVERDSAGNPMRMSGTNWDVTEQKVAEKSLLELKISLEQSQERLIQATTAGGVGVWDWDINNDILTWDERMYELYGVQIGQFTGAYESWQHGLHPDDRAQAEEDIRAAIISGQFESEFRIVKPDGSVRYLRAHARTYKNSDGIVSRMVGTNWDITEQKVAEKSLLELKTSLEQSQERLILATTAGGVGIWEWDIVNDVLVWDAQMYGLYGISGDQFSGAYEAWQAGVHPDDRERTDLEIQNVLAGLKEYDVKYRVLWPDGSIHYIHALGYVERDDSDKPVRMSGTNWDITEQKEAENRAEELAFFDHLTSLPNRRLFADRLQRALKLSERSKQYCALLALDIDNFKNINDLYGHDGGDLVLQATAQHLLKVVRTGDTVARMGGDEFVILLEDLGPNPLEASSAAKTIAEKILAKFNASNNLTSSIPMCSLSIGITTFIGGPVDSNEIMKQSDLALYQAKEAGRNCMRFYDEQMQASINARTSLETALHEAIENDWFVLHYQPQIVGNQRIESAEVLLRLDHPQRGLINPGEFIDLAESTGLILPIGQWVLNAACQQLAAWATQDGMAHLALSVNISIKQFVQANFVSQLIDTVVRTGANPKLITLELTESLFLEDTTDAIQKMQALKDYGFNFSLDDFGTGYSSLSYLKSLPFDELKIDQTFVAETPGNQVGNDIVRTIILMGQTLGLKVVAEGVESKDQLEYLQSIGCQHYQGYLFFHPMPADELVLAITH